MKPLLLTHCDIDGGAARAAYRIHRALLAAGLESRMGVNVAVSEDWTVGGPTSKWKKGAAVGRLLLADVVKKLATTGNPTMHSAAILASEWPRRVNNSDTDVVHLHWINSEMLSISDLPRIRKPIVWTLHDMWAFCGAEHYANDLRWREGYTCHNRPVNETGFDIGRWVWSRKRKAWKKPFQIVTPSRWLASCVQQSALMQNWPVTVIPNAIDTEVWSPVDQGLARRLLGLPDVPLVLFGAIGGHCDPRKGFDLLRAALLHLVGEIKGLELVVVGQLTPRNPVKMRFPVHYLGHLSDDLTLRLLYCAADALVIPSRQDNLPNTGVESLACGTPVVAFNACGLPDIVRHRQTGYLAVPFDPADLAEGIHWVLSDKQRHAGLRINARQQALETFSYPLVADQYIRVYERAINA